MLELAVILIVLAFLGTGFAARTILMPRATQRALLVSVVILGIVWTVFSTVGELCWHLVRPQVHSEKGEITQNLNEKDSNPSNMTGVIVLGLLPACVIALWLLSQEFKRMDAEEPEETERKDRRTIWGRKKDPPN